MLRFYRSDKSLVYTYIILRILRLYVGTKDPSENLQLLAEYIVNVYTPIWFHIKLNHLCINGTKHIFKIIQLSRCFPEKILNTIDTVIQRNAFFLIQKIY